MDCKSLKKFDFSPAPPTLEERKPQVERFEAFLVSCITVFYYHLSVDTRVICD